MKLKINKDIKTPNGKVFKGSVIEIDELDGEPALNFWRNRLKDSAIDNCIEIVSTQKKGK
jgi:hypothetical protein